MRSCKSVLLTGVVAGVLASGPAMAQTLEILSAEGDPASVEAMNWAIGEFQKEHPGVEVDYQVVSWTDLGKKIVASTAAGQSPDVVHLDDFGASVLSGQGLLEPADDVVAAIGIDDYFPAPLKSVTTDGTVWGVPFSNGFNLLWYRKDLYEQHGLEAPKSWDDLLKNASTLNG
jgi:ABC-type glycerol-3-phosphate transport system substrate-binding protein